MPRRGFWITGLVAGMFAAVLPGGTPAGAAPPDGPVVAGGVTQPVFDYAQAIREEALVETAVDSDHDGRRDRVHVWIIRPRETDQGLRVPVIMQPSPYFAGFNDVENHDVDIDNATISGRSDPRSTLDQIIFPGYYDNYFVPRGYAVIYAESLGSGGSDGCPTSGARNETEGIKAVVDWLNGRARATTLDGTPAAAGWTTGKVGMIGVSYNGTLPNAVATTGVPGLETIVPIAAISSWYDYYRANGGVVAPGGFQGEDTDVLAKFVLTRANPETCAAVVDGLTRDQDRITGDYSPFWNERNYLNDAHRIRASVFLVHGLNDWNVKTKHFGQWWQALAARGVPRKLWLHQAAHTNPFNIRRAVWLNTLNRWFDFWLYRIRNGIMDEPMVDVESAPDSWQTHRTWPLPGSRSVPFFLGPAADGRPGTLNALPLGIGQHQGLIDDTQQTAEQLADAETVADPNRLVFLSRPLDSAVRLSGTPRVHVRASLDGRSPFLTALLVDYGTGSRFAGVRSTGVTECIAPGIPGDPGCFTVFAYTTATTPWKIVTRGWLDVRNRHSPGRTDPIVPGQTYGFTWDMQPEDHIFAAGHRIGVLVLSTDRDYTLRYRAGTQVRLALGLSSVWLPLTSRW